MCWGKDVLWLSNFCVSTAPCAHGTWLQRRSTSLCLNLAHSRGRRSSPHAAPTAGMGSLLPLAARTAPSRSGTETSAWVLKPQNVQWVVNSGCLFCYGVRYRVMTLGSSGHRPESSEFNKSPTLRRIQNTWFKVCISKPGVAENVLNSRSDPYWPCYHTSQVHGSERGPELLSFYLISGVIRIYSRCSGSGKFSLGTVLWAKC